MQLGTWITKRRKELKDTPTKEFLIEIMDGDDLEFHGWEIESATMSTFNTNLTSRLFITTKGNVVITVSHHLGVTANLPFNNAGVLITKSIRCVRNFAKGFQIVKKLCYNAGINIRKAV